VYRRGQRRFFVEAWNLHNQLHYAHSPCVDAPLTVCFCTNSRRKNNA